MQEPASLAGFAQHAPAAAGLATGTIRHRANAEPAARAGSGNGLLD